MFKKVIPVTALTTLALSQMLFPGISIAEGTAVKPASAAVSQSIEEIAIPQDGGSPDFISGTLTAASNSAPEAIVYGFLNSAKRTYQLESDAKELFTTAKVEQDDLGYQVVRLQQAYKGIPIFGYQQIAHINKGALQSFSGSVIPEAVIKEGVKEEKKISADQAIAAVQQDLKSQPQFKQKPTADLNIYMHEGKAHLAYVVKLQFLNPEPGNWYYFVDAVSGAIIHKFNNIHFEGSDVTAQAKASATGTGVLGDKKTIQANKIKNKYYLQDYTRGLGIQTFDSAYKDEDTGGLPGKLWVDADGKLNSTYDAPAVDAHYYAGVTYDYYKKTFNRNSFDGNGAAINSHVHYGKNYNNAFWDGTQMVYGDGDGKVFRPLSGALDVVGHEITHAVTERTAGLIYEGESGAINESISDIFATLIEFYNKKSADWLIGEDVYTPSKKGDALRYMDNPTKAGDPDHYSKRYVGDDDNGGVHINSGISNKTAYLISQGGTHYGVTVKGIGQDKLGKIYYRALTQYLTPASNFQHLRYAVIQSAKDLYGAKSSAVTTVTNAFAAVGINGTPADSSIKALTVGKPFSFQLKNAGDVRWFKIDPKSALAKSSHLKFSVTGDADAYISVYKDKASADKGESFPGYANQVNEVNFPLAWNQPFYVKVEGAGIGTFTINNEGIYLEPTDPPEDCVAEISALANPSLGGMLDGLRGIRENLLKNTEKGKAIIDLYYGISRDVVDDAILDSSFRSSVANDLKQLQPVMNELQNISAGKASSYKLTQQDMQAMQHLKETVEKKISKEHAKQLAALWNGLNLSGRDLSTAIKNLGLTGEASSKIIVKVKKGVSLDALTKSVKKSMTALGIQENVKVQGLSNSVVKAEDTYTFEVKNSQLKLVEALKKQNIFEYVEISKTMHALTADVQYPTQWSLQNTGQMTGENGSPGKAGADIKFVQMEKFLSGKKYVDTTIAVVDTGLNYDLDDFAGKVLTSKDYDFVNKDSDAFDDGDHGTHVAGIIGAASGNKLSMAGINQHTKILPVKVLNAEGSGSWEDVALGIRYAADKGAKVINLSLGSKEASAVVEDALRYAFNKGVTIVAAAGNDGETKLSYPARSEFVISVGSTNNIDELSSFSNKGEGLDLVAPGDRIPSFYDDGEIYYASGTSMAAPHVAAVAGLLYSIKPSIKFNEVLEALQESSVDLGDSGYDTATGWGRLDAYQAVKYVSSQKKVAPSIPTVDPVSDKTTYVTGKTEANATVYVKAGTKQLGYGKATATGNFKVKIPAQKVGVVLSVTAKDVAGNVSKAATMKVEDKTPPAVPQVKVVSDKDTYVTGKAEANATVYVKVGTKQLGYGTATAKGDFKVKIPAQKAGVVLSVTANDKYGNVSKVTAMKVLDKTPPAAPRVNAVSNKDTYVIGKAEANATVYVKIGTRQLAYGKATATGDFKIKIPAQGAGTVLSVTAMDANKNQSAAASVKVTVKK